MNKVLLVFLALTIISVHQLQASECVDFSPYCAAWAKNGFCEKPFYNCTVRVQYCAKTCGLCTEGSCVNS